MIIVGVIDARTFWRYLVSSYYIAKDKYFKCSTIDTRIGAIVPLYSVFVSKEDKSKWVSNLFRDLSEMTVMHLFEHVFTNRVTLFKHVGLIEASWVC